MFYLDTHINGIPCVAKLIHYLDVPGTYDPRAETDVDYYGIKECEFELLDSYGNRAKDLEDMATLEDYERISKEIETTLRELANDS